MALFLALVLGTAASTAGRTAAQDPIFVQKVQWGFDGTVVLERFNLLTVRVQNQSARPFRGPVRLRRRTPFGSFLFR